jgi:hypothetical protein
MPKTALVSYSDSGFGSRQSRSCAGAVVVRIINVTGTKAGTQQVNFYRDPFTLSVQ